MVILHGHIAVLHDINCRLLAALQERIPDIQAERYSDIYEDEMGLYLQIAEEHLHLLTPAEIAKCEPYIPTTRNDG